MKKRTVVKRTHGPSTPREHRKIFRAFAKKYAKGLKRQKVTSSNLHSVSYDKEHKVLEVAFRKKDKKHPSAVYRYSGVSPITHQRLLNAPSKGSYFNKKIRSKYSYVKVK